MEERESNKKRRKWRGLGEKDEGKNVANEKKEKGKDEANEEKTKKRMRRMGRKRKELGQGR